MTDQVERDYVDDLAPRSRTTLAFRRELADRSCSFQLLNRYDARVEVPCVAFWQVIARQIVPLPR